MVLNQSSDFVEVVVQGPNNTLDDYWQTIGQPWYGPSQVGAPGTTYDAVSPSIASAASTTLTVGSAGNFTLIASGTPTPSFSESGSHPSGVTLTDNGNGTATLGGTPAAGTVGFYPITITATNGVPANTTQEFTLSVVGLATTTSATVKPSSVTDGAKVSYRAGVSSSTGTPTGSVTFTIGTKNMCTATPRVRPGFVLLDQSSKGGTDTITATYAGSTTYADSSGAATLKVAK